MSFNLLRMPYLVRKEILENMGIIELCLLTRSSKRMKTLIKREVRVRNYDCCIRFHETIQIGFFSNEIERETITSESRENIPGNKKFGFKFSIAEDDTPMFRTFWRDEFDGAQVMFKELTDIFKIPLKSFQIALDETKLDYQKIIFWMNELKEHLIENAKLNGDDSKDIEWIVENSTASDEMRFHSPKITDETIRNCLQKLKSGCNTKLKELNFQIYRQVDLSTIFDGLDMTEEEYGWSFRLDNGDKCTVYDAEFGVDVLLGVQILIERS